MLYRVYFEAYTEEDGYFNTDRIIVADNEDGAKSEIFYEYGEDCCINMISEVED